MQALQYFQYLNDGEKYSKAHEMDTIGEHGDKAPCYEKTPSRLPVIGSDPGLNNPKISPIPYGIILTPKIYLTSHAKPQRKKKADKKIHDSVFKTLDWCKMTLALSNSQNRGVPAMLGRLMLLSDGDSLSPQTSSNALSFPFHASVRHLYWTLDARNCVNKLREISQ